MLNYPDLIRPTLLNEFSLTNVHVRSNTVTRAPHINPLKTKRRLLYLKPQSVPRCKHFSSRL